MGYIREPYGFDGYVVVEWDCVIYQRLERRMLNLVAKQIRFRLHASYGWHGAATKVALNGPHPDIDDCNPAFCYVLNQRKIVPLANGTIH
jgi:hypothetical protein